MVMDAIRKQAIKLREQVANQQQALMKQLRHFDAKAIFKDEEELKCHQQLQNIYKSTRQCKRLQKDVVRGCQGFVFTHSKQMEIVRKFAEDCSQFGIKEESSSPLAEIAFRVGTSHDLMEDEMKILLGILDDKVCEPLRALITRDAQLEDARLLVRHYEKLWQQLENQAMDLERQQSKSRNDTTSENSLKIQIAEAKLDDLKCRLMVIGKRANSAMLPVEKRQQQQTEDYLLMMVEAERCYHQNVVVILENLLEEMTISSQIDATLSDPDNADLVDRYCSDESYFIALVIHPFDALEEGELNLTMDEFVVVYQVSGGWYKGESHGQTGWFPSAYVHTVHNEDYQQYNLQIETVLV